eukprot:13681495-Ditylum_brightwellii.AAC.1
MFDIFETRLKDHQKQVLKLKDLSSFELQALHHDHVLHPRTEKDCDGNVVFDLSEAKKLPKKDIKDGKHLVMTPAELQHSHDKYKPYPPKKFKHTIYQTVKRQKLINYLNNKHEKTHNKISC